MLTESSNINLSYKTRLAEKYVFHLSPKRPGRSEHQKAAARGRTSALSTPYSY